MMVVTSVIVVGTVSVLTTVVVGPVTVEPGPVTVRSVVTVWVGPGTVCRIVLKTVPFTVLTSVRYCVSVRVWFFVTGTRTRFPFLVTTRRYVFPLTVTMSVDGGPGTLIVLVIS